MEIFHDPTLAVPDKCEILLSSRSASTSMAAATPMTRDEFVARQTAEREAAHRDPGRPRRRARRWSTWPPTRRPGSQSYLGALEEGGLLRPEDEAPPIRRDPKVVSTLAVLASGVLVGPAGGLIARSPSSLVGVLRAGARVVRRHAGDNSPRSRATTIANPTSAASTTSRSRRCPTSPTTTSACRIRHLLPGVQRLLALRGSRRRGRTSEYARRSLAR